MWYSPSNDVLREIILRSVDMQVPYVSILFGVFRLPITSPNYLIIGTAMTGGNMLSCALLAQRAWC